MSGVTISIAGGVGVVLTAGFIMWEVGHYATPQVTETRFDERREIFAYTVGLFVGIVLVIPWLYFLLAFSNAALLGVFVFLLIIVAGIEIAQWAIGRTRYWGSGPSLPFYAVGLRSGVGGLLITGLLAQFLAGPWSWSGTAVVALQSVALVVLMPASALQSLPAPSPASGRPGGGPVSSAVLLFVGLFLLGFNAFGGVVIGGAAAVIALIGGIFVYTRLRVILDRIRPPAPAGRPGALPSRFARTDRPGDAPKSP